MNSLAEVQKWKGDPIVAKCHKLLFKREKEEDPATYMTRIIDKIWPEKKNAPKLHIAYAISVCEFFLNPSNIRIQVSEASIKSQIYKYSQRILNKEKLSSDVEGSEEGDHEIIRDEQEVEDGEIQCDNNENIESDDCCSSEDESASLEILRKKYKRNH